jgi:hypothetical protein
MCSRRMNRDTVTLLCSIWHRHEIYPPERMAIMTADPREVRGSSTLRRRRLRVQGFFECDVQKTPHGTKKHEREIASSDMPNQ